MYKMLLSKYFIKMRRRKYFYFIFGEEYFMRRLKQLVAMILVVCMLITLCPSDVSARTSKAAVKSVTVTNLVTNKLVLKKGTKFRVKPRVVVTGKISKKVTYVSSNKKIVTVDNKGVVKAVKSGKAVVAVKSAANPKVMYRFNVYVGVPTKTVKLSAKAVNMFKGTSRTLKASIAPKNATYKRIQWSSSDKRIATVSSKGVVKAVKVGRVYITAKAMDGSGKYARCKITVKQPVTSIKLSAATLTITEGSSKTLTATVAPASATNKTLSWTSSNKKIATVSAKGVVKAIAPGTATITAKAADGSGKKATCKVTVNKKVTVENKYESQGYKLLWHDEFDGTELNRDIWNVELHEPGWVNNELQSYVDSEDNIKVKNGTLIISSKKKVNEDGSISYTSGRVNTQNKQDFKYGRVQFRAKVPTGKGYLPAAWMMPTNESLYGQWPRCGEIDVMEVLGDNTYTTYGTIHYGNPHSESQGKYTLSNGKSFADSYHVFTCDWEPGKITWYVDGVKMHEENDWYSTTAGKGTVTYPAPFDQPFYVILNLAVGGNWPGNPDADADYINSESLYVDYVRVYQKESYDENVTKPEREVIIRDPDENGNYVINGDFSETEDLGDAENWIFMAQNGGEGTAVIENNTININTIDAGTVDYSIQLVQPDIPVEKGATYKLSFDAWADEARTGIIDVSAPTRSWGRYLKDTKFDMTTEKQTFEYEYTMTDSSDDKGRIEFNFGNQGSVAGVHIANVKLVKTNQTEIVDKKTILADGNLVYNGEFQEGTGRLGYWTVSNNCGAEYKVTGLSDGRRFSYKSLDESIDGNFVLSQDELAYAPNTKYVLKFDAETATEGKNIIITTGDSKFAVTLDKGSKNYVYKFETGEEVTDSSISIDFGNSGEVLLDNVKIMQDSLLLNGNFSADFAGYDVYIDSSADAESVVDSQKEDNAADFTIKNSGDQNWKIQLKQNNIKLEKGQWYKLSFDIKSSVSRTVQYAIQRDGSTHKDSTGAEDWTPYVQETVKLDAYDQADQKYMTVSNTFQMACDTDEESIFNIALGAGGENGSAITDQHRICIDNIVLEKTSAPEIDVPVGKNLITNSEFEMSEDGSLAGWENAVTAPGDATFEAGDGKITYSVENVGEADWNIQLKQMGLSLEQGESYTLKCTLVSDVDRVVKVAVMTPSAGYAWHGGEDVVLTAGEAKDVTLTITPKEEVFTDGITVDTGAGLFFSMGYVEGYTLGAHTVSISNVSFVKN